MSTIHRDVPAENSSDWPNKNSREQLFHGSGTLLTASAAWVPGAKLPQKMQHPGTI